MRLFINFTEPVEDQTKGSSEMVFNSRSTLCEYDNSERTQAITQCQAPLTIDSVMIYHRVLLDLNQPQLAVLLLGESTRALTPPSMDSLSWNNPALASVTPQVSPLEEEISTSRLNQKPIILHCPPLPRCHNSSKLYIQWIPQFTVV